MGTVSRGVSPVSVEPHKHQRCPQSRMNGTDSTRSTPQPPLAVSVDFLPRSCAFLRRHLSPALSHARVRDGAARWPLSCTRRVLDRRVTYKRVFFGWPPVDGSGKLTVTSLALVRFGVWRYDRCCAIPTCLFDLRPPHKCPDPPRRAQGPGGTVRTKYQQ